MSYSGGWWLNFQKLLRVGFSLPLNGNNPREKYKHIELKLNLFFYSKLVTNHIRLH